MGTEVHNDDSRENFSVQPTSSLLTEQIVSSSDAGDVTRSPKIQNPVPLPLKPFPSPSCSTPPLFHSTSNLTSPVSGGSYTSDSSHNSPITPSSPTKSITVVAPKNHKDSTHLSRESSLVTVKLEDPTSYWILHPSLIGKKLVVIAHGGGYLNKQLAVTPIRRDGDEVEVVWEHYNKRYFIHPQWVFPRRPNYARDNGLLIVVQGEHAGKYARRFNHKTSGIMYVEVVDHSEGRMDRLTGEELSLETQDLCLAFESSGDKELNKNVMKPKRSQYYKSHRRRG